MSKFLLSYKIVITHDIKQHRFPNPSDKLCDEDEEEDGYKQWHFWWNLESQIPALAIWMLMFYLGGPLWATWHSKVGRRETRRTSRSFSKWDHRGKWRCVGWHVSLRTSWSDSDQWCCPNDMIPGKPLGLARFGQGSFPFICNLFWGYATFGPITLTASDYTHL